MKLNAATAAKGGVWGSVVSYYGLHTILDTIASKGWHTIVARSDGFACIFLPPSFFRDLQQNKWLLVPAPDRAQCPHGYGNTIRGLQKYMHEFHADRDHAMCKPSEQYHSSNSAHTASKPFI
jgi:hypothetical protein